MLFENPSAREICLSITSSKRYRQVHTDAVSDDTPGQNNLTPAQLAMGDRAGGRGCEGVRHGSVSPFSSGDCGVPNLLIFFLNFAPVIMHSIAVSYDFLYS